LRFEFALNIFTAACIQALRFSPGGQPQPVQGNRAGGGQSRSDNRRSRALAFSFFCGKKTDLSDLRISINAEYDLQTYYICKDKC
jgi:hypothetical protein